VATRSLQGIHGSGGAIDLPSFPNAVNLNQLGPSFDFDPNAGGGLFSGLLNPSNNGSQPIKPGLQGAGKAPDISGFGHVGAHPAVVDLIDFDSNALFTESTSNGNLTLTATEYGNTTTLTFDNFNGSLNFASDGSRTSRRPVPRISGRSIRA
jgi:hypothetical protein